MCLARILGLLGRALGSLVDDPAKSDWPANPHTYDYRQDKRMLGHNYDILEIVDDGKALKVSGWGPGGTLLGPRGRLRRGDYVIFSRTGGGLAAISNETRYRVASVEYKRDPQDQWFAELWWQGRPECQTDWSPEELSAYHAAQ